MRHIYTLVSKLPLPLDHILPGVEAFDPYITTQVNGIHTIAYRMDDENKNPKLVLN